MLLALAEPALASSEDDEAICAHPQLTDTIAAKAKVQLTERNTFRIKSPPLISDKAARGQFSSYFKMLSAEIW
jgi:hypothetical protein